MLAAHLQHRPASATPLRHYPEPRGLRDRHHFALHTAHLHEPVVRHGAQRAREIARLPAREFRQGRNGARLGFLYQAQQRAVFVAEHFRQGPHGGEPNLRVLGARLKFTTGDSEHTLANLFFGQDTDGYGFHVLKISSADIFIQRAFPLSPPVFRYRLHRSQ